MLSPAWSKTIHVPADSATIQAGIDGAVHGDTVLVADGVYTGEGNKNLDFLGKAIVVRSENGPEKTVIDCEGGGRGFYFHSGESLESRVEGFCITGGSRSDDGGAIQCHNSSPTISNCYIIKNHTWSDGGGISCVHSFADIVGCLISENEVLAQRWQTANGGGLYSIGATIRNCIITNNSASVVEQWGRAFGGGIACESSNITNCVICNNHASFSGGGIWAAEESTEIKNCIICDNGGGELDGNGNIIATYSNIPGGWPGEGNIDQDPLFRDPDNDDYHLMAIVCGDSLDSPCIDAGDPGILDDSLDCWHGLGTSRSDMGAYGGANAGWPTAVEEENGHSESVPMDFLLFQNYPNPFNSETVLRFSLPESELAKIIIYNILGQKLQALVEERRDAGQHSIIWDASGLPSGIYFARLEAGGHSEIIKMVLMK